MHIKENAVNLEQLEDATMWTHFLLDEILWYANEKLQHSKIILSQKKKKKFKDYMTK